MQRYRIWVAISGPWIVTCITLLWDIISNVKFFFALRLPLDGTSFVKAMVLLVVRLCDHVVLAGKLTKPLTWGSNPFSCSVLRAVMEGLAGGDVALR